MSAQHDEQVASRYERAARRYQALYERLDQQIGRVAAVRFIAFVVGGACLFSGWYDRAWTLYAPLATVAWLIFIAALVIHRRLYDVAPRAEMASKATQEAAARVRHDWSALSDGGERYLSADPIERELQLFGEVSAYKSISRAQLRGSKSRVAALLKGVLSMSDPFDPQEIIRRQASAKALAPLRMLRLRVEVEARVGGSAHGDLGSFTQWAEAGHREGEMPERWRWVALGGLTLVTLTLIQAVITLSTDTPTLWEVTLVAQLLLYAGTTGRITEQYAPLIHETHRPLLGLSRCFQLLESRHVDDPGLIEWRDHLNEGGAPSARIAEIAKRADALAVRHSALLYGVLSIFFLWELWHGVKVWSWRSTHGARVRRDLEALYDWEALSSIAGLAEDHPDFAWPDIHTRTNSAVIEAQKIAHPLFHPHTRKANDFTLSGRGQLLLVTGSNMSGKSSFLRTLGLNARLAFAGAPVCAEALSLARLQVATSIQITDDPTQGWSRFYAEVRRISEVIQRAEAAPAERPILYLIDEMLSGTNSRERRLASRTITQRLLNAPHSFGLITTHDLDLASLTERFPTHMSCAHFSDQFDGERLHFDYQLRDGVATTTNALHVLKMEGIEVIETEET